MDTNTPLTRLANSLADLYIDRADTLAKQRDLKNAIAYLELNFPEPADGWAGKTADDRARSRKIAISSNPQARDFAERLAIIEHELDEIQAAIDGVTDQRRALEWSIRLTLVNYLAGKADPHRDDADRAFDLAAQDTMDNALDAAIEAGAPTDNIDIIL